MIALARVHRSHLLLMLLLNTPCDTEEFNGRGEHQHFFPKAMAKPRSSLLVSPQIIPLGFVLSVLTRALNITKSGGSAASLGNLSQCLPTLPGQKGFIPTNVNPIIPIKPSFCEQSVTQSDGEAHRVLSATESTIIFPQFPQLITFHSYQMLELFKQLWYPTHFISHTHLPKPLLLN